MNTETCRKCDNQTSHFLGVEPAGYYIAKKCNCPKAERVSIYYFSRQAAELALRSGNWSPKNVTR